MKPKTISLTTEFPLNKEFVWHKTIVKIIVLKQVFALFIL